MKKLAIIFLLLISWNLLDAQDPLTQLNYNYDPDKGGQDWFAELERFKDNWGNVVFSALMDSMVQDGRAYEQEDTWFVGLPDTSGGYDPTVIWEPTNTEMNKSMTGGFFFEPFSISGSDTTAVMMARLVYRIISIDKITLRMTQSLNQVQDNPNDNFVKLMLSPNAYRDKAKRMQGLRDLKNRRDKTKEKK